jgi:cytoskeleton protein RodZ
MIETVPAGAAAVTTAPAITHAPDQNVPPAPASLSAAATRPGGTSSAAAAAAAAPQVTASGPIVSFRTKGPSWIQVTDATGATVLRKLMEPGESATASGTLPLSVTVGSVETTEVQVRGKPYNLAPVSKDNVARFEVK